MTNIDEVTTTDIEDLVQAAALAGDEEMIAVCRRALAGNAAARKECEEIIVEARREFAHQDKLWAEAKS